MKKWEKFSKEELITIISNSKTYSEALRQLGYSGASNYNYHIKDIAQKYDIDISHFSTGSVIDLTNQRFGKLTVIERVPSKNGAVARWSCKCDCGNFTEVDGTKLRRNETLSCGCLTKEKLIKFNKEIKFEDLTGRRFGKLLVISRAENVGIQPAWNCQCDCGNKVIVIGSNLKSPERGTQSCGCLSSKGELKIINLLKQYNFNFETQKKFKDCLSKKGFPLRFDFGIYNKNNELLYLIEYNGRQHYEEVSCWDNEHDNFEERIERDLIKKEYCEKNNIPLIIIPYTAFSNLTINDLMLETSNYIYKKENK